MADQPQDNDSLMKSAMARAAELIETDPEARAATPKPEVSEANNASGLRPIDILAKACEAYADRPALGQRAYEIVENGASGNRSVRHLPRYATISYHEFFSRVTGLATAWARHDEAQVCARDFVCLLGFASTDYLVAEMACLHAGATSVPLQTTMAPDDFASILDDTRPTCLVVGLEYIERILPSIAESSRPLSLVVIDYVPEDDTQRDKFDAIHRRIEDETPSVRLTTLANLVTFGQSQMPAMPLIPDPGEDLLTTLVYTSGSTGSPKGAMIPESNWSQIFIETPPPMPVISMAYHPLNHALARTINIRTLIRGGRVNFVLKSDMSTLLEDIRLTRPTLLELVPRVSELIYHEYQTAALRRAEDRDEALPVAQAEIMADMHRTFLGDRLLTILVTTAPTAPEIQAFLRACFQVPVFNSMGSTESSGITSDCRILRPPVIDYRLVDVPELGYLTSDKPYPRGELRLKSQRNTLGYFKRPEATAALFDADGYLITGDVFEERGPDHLVWIDRKNNVLKLSQGEFVTISPLETSLESDSPLIRQIHLYGNSERAYLLAVVVPNIETCRSRLGHEPSADELKQMLRRALNETARDQQLRSYEVPRDFLVELEPFTSQNGLLTDMRKPRRPALKSKYGDRLEALYVQLEEQKLREFVELTRKGSDASVIDKVRKAIEATLGLADLDPAQCVNFTELGGDSLSSVSLSLLLEQVFGFDVPLSVILNPAGTIESLARHIEDILDRGGESALPDFALVHGETANRVLASDLLLAKFLDADTLENAARRPAMTDDTPARTVLLTGANGFLGRFLCLEWMSRLAPVGGKVICIVRGSDDAEARARLSTTFERDDSQLAADFKALAEHHLEVIAGDLAAPNLGLSDADHARLAEQVDTIVHAGALVNHVLSYSQLFEPNVSGTAELIRLALRGRPKQFDFVSSAAVLVGDGSASPSSEEEDIRRLRPSMPLGSGYASGYGASKWAGEVLLREAHEHFNLPVNIYRSDMILPHSVYRGQINAPDMFIRILFSVIATGIAPASFYRTGASATQRAHYGGLPVDFTAASISAIGADRHRGFDSYDVVNPHADDGISLDRIIDWAQSKGHVIERIEDYSDWLKLFDTRLRALPADRQSHSSLLLMEQFAWPTTPGEADTSVGRFQKKVRVLRIGQDADIPHLSEVYIHKCLDDMVQLGLITAPA